MKSLVKRTLSGAVLVAIMVGAILCSPLTLLALVVAVTVGSLYEFYRLSIPDSKKIYPPIVLGAVAVVAAYLVVWQIIPPQGLFLLLPLFLLLLIGRIFCQNGGTLDAGGVQTLGAQALGLIYIALPLSLLPALGVQIGADGAPAYNAGVVLFYVILIWINDVGAYLVGMTLGRHGKHPLCKRLSPKKSWEGFFGGLIFTAVAAVWLGARMTGAENTPVWGWIVGGVVLTLSAVAGDLVESMFKREAGVKDSGNLIPGHGGLLDRFDAMYLSLPFVYLLTQLMR
ncbi:MAG: phosphatidate cytidylyltransferase [Rikenellaceae bacterium]|jgi:phosphatidate cytidylyltransferase|nr:phosphatidate cytidylyltransferase [Rikenellaceae bacterium]